jgi:hypothetical protein
MKEGYGLRQVIRPGAGEEPEGFCELMRVEDFLTGNLLPLDLLSKVSDSSDPNQEKSRKALRPAEARRAEGAGKHYAVFGFRWRWISRTLSLSCMNNYVYRITGHPAGPKKSL